MNCREFEGMLGPLLDGALDPETHGLCRRHAAACAGCGALVAPMGAALAPVSVAPPFSLLSGVLARTTQRPRRVPWAETWRQWMHRPRFASEVAYVGVVVLSLAAGSVRPRDVINDIRSEAGILLHRATSLWEKETP
jgi:hypothetical protein